MPLPRYTAVEFRRPMERGLNDPFLVMGECEEGGDLKTLVVKSRAGYKNRPEAMVRELFALLLARSLGLLTPEPVWVNLPQGLDWGASEFPVHAELIRQSVGWNLATVHLGTGWKPWTQAAAPRSISGGGMEDAYAYDAMIQNSDREADNPNLLWRGNQLALLDFDKAFAYLRTHETEKRPWRHTLGMQGLRNHCLFRYMPQYVDNQCVGANLWGNFEEWRLANQPGQISEQVREAFADPDLDLPRIESYLIKLASATEDFFSFLTEASRR